MRTLPNFPFRVVSLLLLGVAVVAALFFAGRWGLSLSHQMSYADLSGWQQISGHWSKRGDVFSNSNYGRGDMLIARHSQGTNYRVSAEVRFDLLFSETHMGDAGLVIRASDPETGVDSYRGYYVGLRPDAQALILGRASYDWNQLESVHLETPVSPGSWYKLEVVAQGCHFQVTATPVDGRPATHLDHFDKDCLTEGVAGLRSFYTQASWRNVKIGQ